MSADAAGLAERIADRLCEEALRHEGCATWLGDERENVNGSWEVVHRSVGGDLYCGTAGIGIFLTRMYASTGVRRYRDTARAAFAYAANWEKRERPTASLYNGSLGIAAALVEAAATFPDEQLRFAARSIVLDSVARVPQTDNDLIAGRAGAIVALLYLGAALDLADVLDLACELGDQLAVHAVTVPYGGAGWMSDIGTGEPPLCGLAHGASGPAYALGELAQVTGCSEYSNLAARATSYERAWFDRERGNWPDLREITRASLSRGRAPTYPMFWCHGGVGIGLVRLRRYELEGSSADAAEAEAAIQSAQKFLAATTSHGTGLDLSVCHGLAGCTELFIEGARVFGQPELLDTVDECVDIAATVADDGARPWLCGVPEGGENPSLMLGLAGIGMMFLRAADAEVAGVGLLYPRPMQGNRLIVKLEGPPTPRQLARRAEELAALVPGARVERFSKSGRVLLQLPASVSLERTVATLESLDDVVYVELDVVDHATDAG